MLKNIDELSLEQKLQLILAGQDYVACVVSQDYLDYKSFKKGELTEVSEEKLQAMQILELLENLGFPMEMTGTYLYKEVILSAAKKLQAFNSRRDLGVCKDLLAQMKDAYSNFYFDIARNDLEMGVRTFHLALVEALEKVDSTKANQILLYHSFDK